MDTPDLSLAIQFCDGLRRWVELPPEMSVSEEHVDVPSTPGWDGLEDAADYSSSYSLDDGLEIGLFPLRKDADGVIHCIAAKGLEDLLRDHGEKRILKFFADAGEQMDLEALAENVEITVDKAMVSVRHMSHQIRLLAIFDSHGKSLEMAQAGNGATDLMAILDRDLQLLKSRRVRAREWMEHVIAHGTTEACIEMLRAFSRLADKPELLSRCVAGVEDLALHLRPPIEAALTLRSNFMGCGSRLATSGPTFLKDQNRFLTLCQELKTKLERQRGDLEGQIENLIDNGKTYCLYGGSQLALRVMSRLRQKMDFRLLLLENETKEISRLRKGVELPRYPGWETVRLGRLSAKTRQVLASVPTVFAGVCCAVPEGAYVENGLQETLGQLRRISGSDSGSEHRPQLALVLGGHKFVKGQIGTPAYYRREMLQPFHEFLPFDQIRYLVG